jgi:CRISPR-associated protein Csb1
MNTKLTLDTLQTAVRGSAAAFRCRNRLQPAGGEGTKAFPPTYSGAIYATEKRRVKNADGSSTEIPCVLLDSVQSQANRHEEALQHAIDTGAVQLPLVVTDFTGEPPLDAVGKITSLTAPHRVADAILRDSEIDENDKKVPFRKSAEGKKLDTVSLQNATALYELCPTALIFGIWDSTGPKGGLGAKFQRAFVSEIVGINAVGGVKTSSRIDPLQIRAQALIVKKSDGTYAAAESEKTKGAVKPSEINHGNIVPGVDNKTGGVTLDYAEQTAVLSLPALRRLHFPVNKDGTLVRTADVDAAGQTVLAALALYAAALANETGFDLRSRCLLWPEAASEWELLEKPGAPTKLTITAADALAVLKEAVAAAESLGLIWRKEPLKLKPSQSLVALVKKSQELAAAAPAEE